MKTSDNSTTPRRLASLWYKNAYYWNHRWIGAQRLSRDTLWTSVNFGVHRPATWRCASVFVPLREHVRDKLQRMGKDDLD